MDILKLLKPSTKGLEGVLEGDQPVAALYITHAN
jgi:hypothetical protein